MKLVILPFLFLLTVLGSCEKVSSPNTPNENTPLPSDPYIRWKSYQYHNYSIEQRFIFFGPAGENIMKITVCDDTIHNVAVASNGSTIDTSEWVRYKIVDSLFSFIETMKKDTMATLIVSYDSLYGYPTYIYCDPIKGISDEEYGWQTKNVIKVNYR